MRGELHVSIRRRHELEIADILRRCGKARFKIEATRYERQIHISSASIPEYLEKIENLKKMIKSVIPSSAAGSSQDSS